VKARNGKNRTRTEPESNLADWPIQYNRSGLPSPSFTALPAAFRTVVLAILPDYLGIGASYRNEAVRTNTAGDRNPVMTTFDRRKETFERKFALDEEMKFKAEARRNKLLGLWVADRLGLSGDAAKAYASDVVASNFESNGDGVIRKVTGDLDAKGVTFNEAELRTKMGELMAHAIVQVKTGR
jgi:hypothetical protein